MTTPTAPIYITLAVPTPFAVDPARLVAWLEGRGYRTDPSDDSSLWANYTRDDRTVSIPLHQDYSDYSRCLCSAVIGAARREGLEPAALAALLAPPVEGPALQWAMMSERARSEVIARIADLAATDRKSVAILRADGCADQALEAEGDALGLEAAAAVLRSPAAPPPDLSALRGELLRSGQVEALDALDRLSGAGRRGSEG